MRIGPKDPYSGVPQEPEQVKQKPSETEFPTAPVDTPGLAEGTDRAGSSKSVYTGFTDRTGLGGEFVRQTLGDFKGSVADADLERIGSMLASHMDEDPVVQGKLDRILSLAK
jgi:hypothetical protein